MNTAELSSVCKAVRRDIINMTANAGSGHPGGSLSAVELMVSVFFNHMRIDPQNPKMPERDRFVLSKGHAAPCYYAVLAERGFISRGEFQNFRQLHSILQGHPDCKKVPGVDASTGSLGQGCSIAVGMALGAKVQKQDVNVYTILGDGECQEGQVWEALMSAAHYKLDNLTVIIDNNGLQIDGSNNEVMSLGDLAAKVRRLRLRGVRAGRPRPRSHRGGAERQNRPRRAEVHPRPHRQGQGRLLHGEPGGLARQGTQRGAAPAGFEGIGGLRP